MPDQVVIDAGSKTFTSDRYDDGYHGAVLGYLDAKLHTLNEEHGYVDVSALGERRSSASGSASSRTTRAAA